MSGLDKLPEEVKKELIRLMVLLNEIDIIKENNLSKPRLPIVQNTIDYLEGQIREIREGFLKDKAKKK